jgi:hypothetical protein
MKDLKNFSLTELEAEIEKRKKEAQKPYPLETINWNYVLAMAVDHVKSRYDGSYHEDNDEKQYMFEEVMKAVYGDKIFDKLNKLRS